MKYQVWIYRKNKWKVLDFKYSYNRALLAYCRQCIRHGSANVRFYSVASSESVTRITLEPSYGKETLITDEMRME